MREIRLMWIRLKSKSLISRMLSETEGVRCQPCCWHPIQINLSLWWRADLILGAIDNLILAILITKDN